MLAALAALLITLMMGAALARGLVVHRQQQRADQQRQQGFWFAESAMQRAVARTRSSKDYSGETWRVSMEIDGQSYAGIAEIRVRTAPDDHQLRIITLDARWPDHPLDRVLEQREIIITPSDMGASP